MIDGPPPLPRHARPSRFWLKTNDRVNVSHTHAEHVRLLRKCSVTRSTRWSVPYTGGTRDHCQGDGNSMIINDGHGTEVNRVIVISCAPHLPREHLDSITHPF